MSLIAIKRVYEPATVDDGIRVLVDRLWPRGLKKDQARIDHWFKQLAPSTALRQWFGHEPEKWNEFRLRYCAELGANTAALVPLRTLLQLDAKVTLLFAAKDEVHNNAVVLAAYLQVKPPH